MANEYSVNASDMTAVAKAIRDKGGISDALSFPDGFVQAITGIETNAVAFEYTGVCTVTTDQDGNWQITFLTSGIFTPLKDYAIDVFAVGAGGGGRLGGGGGGYCVNAKITLTAGEQYEIVIGEGVAGERGGSTNAFGATAEGGYPGSESGPGGNGQSGGGGWANGGRGGDGGANGEDGEQSWGSGIIGGTGEAVSSRPFGADTGTPCSPGGGGGDYGGGRAGKGGAYGGGDGGSEKKGADGKPNTGGGGGGSNHSVSGWTKGGTGVAMIRNSRE